MTLFNNIAYGVLRDTSEAKVIAAAKVANAWEFIQQLPNGLQHYWLQRDLEVAVVDLESTGVQYLLPAGPLREPQSRLQTVGFIVSNAYKPVTGVDTQADLDHVRSLVIKQA